ncbi:MAG: MmcQ/YjbR family DNA-binding protein [Planctomycetota bacterium]
MAKKKSTIERLREQALRFPGAEESTSCNKARFEVGKKAYLFLGEKADEYNIMLKVRESKPKVEELAAQEPERYSVNGIGWVTVRFRSDETPPAGLLEAWLDESHRILIPSKAAKKAPQKKNAAKKKTSH